MTRRVESAPVRSDLLGQEHPLRLECCGAKRKKNIPLTVFSLLVFERYNRTQVYNRVQAMRDTFRAIACPNVHPLTLSIYLVVFLVTVL